MDAFTMEFFPTDEAVEEVSAKITDFMSSKRIDKKSIVKIRLNVEDVLLSWRNSLPEDNKITISCVSKIGKVQIKLSFEGDKYNPFTDRIKDEFGAWAGGMIARLEKEPTYTYFKKVNNVVFTVDKPKLNQLVVILIAIASAILVASIGSLLVPLEIREEITDNIIEPICDAYLGIIGFGGIPLIFLSMVTGIVGVGDINTFTKIGKKMILGFMLTLAAITGLMVVASLPFFDLNFGTNSTAFNYKEFLSMLLSFLPDNMLSPFIDCNAMQLIIMGVATGAAILVLKLSKSTFMNAVIDFNNITLEIFGWAAKLIPAFVFISVAKSIWVSGIDQILSAWTSWVVTTGAQIAVVIVMALLFALRSKTNVFLILKKVSKTFLIALGTDSCSASVPEEYECCGGKLGLDPNAFVFGIPVGTSTFKPATAVRLVSLAFFMAAAYGTEISIGWLIRLFVLSIVFSIAIPAIPGGVLMFASMFFDQLGIPTDVVSQMLATDIFFDATCTAFNQVSMELSLGAYSAGNKLINLDTLRKK